jgi:DNA-binding NarL/FixJ family response regulator
MQHNPPPPIEPKKVLIVDDHPVLREGLAAVINLQHGLTVCGDAGTAPGAHFAIAKLHPDVVIVDLSLEDGSGLDLIKDIHAQKPNLPILALTMHREDIYGPRAIGAGARGFVMKCEPVGLVVAALRKLLNGQMAVSETLVKLLVDRRGGYKPPVAPSPALRLSDRELEIFRCFGEGRSTRKIAAKLKIALSTVESHRASIKRKLNLANATELVSAASRFVAEDVRT